MGSNRTSSPYPAPVIFPRKQRRRKKKDPPPLKRGADFDINPTRRRQPKPRSDKALRKKLLKRRSYLKASRRGKY